MPPNGVFVERYDAVEQPLCERVALRTGRLEADESAGFVARPCLGLVASEEGIAARGVSDPLLEASELGLHGLVDLPE